MINKFYMDNKSIIFAARYMFPVTSSAIKNGAVYVRNGIIYDFGDLKKITSRYKDVVVRELGSGILMPGFINAHTHLELGSLKAKLEPGDSFPSWILEILKYRLGLTKKKAIESVQKGIESLIRSGVVGVGEISTLGYDVEPLSKSHLYTVLFKEFTSAKKLNQGMFKSSDSMEQRPFLHAPYSTSSEAYILASKLFNTYGTHIAESIDEFKLITGKSNEFIKKFSPFIRRKPLMRRSISPVDYICRLGFLDKNATLVHFVHIDKYDLELARVHNSGIVLCPRSNAYLGVGLPRIDLLYDYPRVGLGTDGLSSNVSLDMTEEIRFLYLMSRPIIKEKAEFFAIRAATIGSAMSLFIEDKLGSIEKGKLGALIYLDTEITKNFYLSIINTQSSQIRNLTDV
ncbi:MAG: amidohydrolase family protein [Deltaproteobacteria bacterium]|nr:amidohydrolase family protein [Deltaproteobacteria bacterium]MCL5791587.1 amidohydrolase family protein [Deltaproteobacteria bacterium]